LRFRPQRFNASALLTRGCIAALFYMNCTQDGAQKSANIDLKIHFEGKANG
jgi:hypothetical protein